MSARKARNLTDTWHGRFCFPALYEPVSFVIHLDHSGDWLTGRVEEPGMRSAAGNLLTSTVSGRVSGDAVTFLKIYDAQIRGYDAVHYAGDIRDEGLEIAGTWRIHGNWSGTFIMIRSRGLLLAAARKRAEKV